VAGFFAFISRYFFITFSFHALSAGDSLRVPFFAFFALDTFGALRDAFAILYVLKEMCVYRTRMNVTAVNNAELAVMRMKAMVLGTKLQDWLNGLNNDEREFFYADAGILFTQYGIAANTLQNLVGRVGGLQEFVNAISANLILFSYFSNIAMLIGA